MRNALYHVAGSPCESLMLNKIARPRRELQFTNIIHRSGGAAPADSRNRRSIIEGTGKP
jgi:hypothetical protein